MRTGARDATAPMGLVLPSQDAILYLLPSVFNPRRTCESRVNEFRIPPQLPAGVSTPAARRAGGTRSGAGASTDVSEAGPAPVRVRRKYRGRDADGNRPREARGGGDNSRRRRTDGNSSASYA